MKIKFCLFAIFSMLFRYAGNAQITITEVLMPQYIQGLNTGGNTGRVPFVCRLTLNGLLPDSNYRYITRIVLASNTATNAGAGNSIYVPPTGNFVRPTTSPANFNTPGDYGTFTASATGSYTGWFALEPTANSTRFIPGNELFFRIILNDGSTGTAFASYPTAPSAIKVIDYSAAAPNAGTGIRATSGNIMSATNFVMLYDNEAATGRPISSTFVEDEGTTGTSYAPFYLNHVNAVDKAWGTIIPNILPGGIKSIVQFDRSTGNVVSNSVSATGLWPGTGGGIANTVNPTGGLTEIVLDGSLVVLSVKFSRVTGSSINNDNVIEWISSTTAERVDFEIERSTDARTYSAIGVLPNNRISGEQHFRFVDRNQQGRKFFYRIKAKESTGQVSYSPVVLLQTNDKATFSAYPNPVQQEMVIKHAKAERNAVIQLFDMNGKMIKRWIVLEGVMQTNLQKVNIPPGTYMLNYQNGKNTERFQFIKQ